MGSDLSMGMLRQALNKKLSERVVWIQAEAAELPLADAAFDAVLCASGFHCFRQPLAALREMRRVLRPGGSLVLVDWCDDYVTCKLCSWWLRWTDPAYYRTYSLRQCQALLEEAGMLVAARSRFRVSWLWGMMRFICTRPEQN